MIGRLLITTTGSEKRDHFTLFPNFYFKTSLEPGSYGRDFWHDYFFIILLHLQGICATPYSGVGGIKRTCTLQSHVKKNCHFMPHFGSSSLRPGHLL